MKKVLLDASSAILLLKAGLLTKLTDFYHVSQTQSVFLELTSNNRYGADKFRQYGAERKLKILNVDNVIGPLDTTNQALHSLDQGESDIIRCFKTGKHDFIIIDDGPAAKYCNKNNIDFINALLFPRVLFFSNNISLDECKGYMDQLVLNGRYSGEVIAWAYNCKRESLHFAIADNCGIDM
jgi:predicted nucleic acid-binding protein